MSRYDSGGRKKDYKKYVENYDKIFGDAVWPCKTCGNTRQQGHKMSCPEHWKNK